MAKQNFSYYIKREQHKKRPGIHTKSQNKASKRQKKQTRYKGQGRGWQTSLDILYLGHERNNN